MQENVKEREICTLADVAIHQGHMIARERNHLCTVLDVKIIERGLSQKLEEGYSIRNEARNGRWHSPRPLPALPTLLRFGVVVSAQMAERYNDGTMRHF